MYKMGETVEMSTFSTEQVHVSFPPLKNMFKVPRKQIYFLGKNIDMLIKERWKFSAMQIKIKKPYCCQYIKTNWILRLAHVWFLLRLILPQLWIPASFNYNVSLHFATDLV